MSCTPLFITGTARGGTTLLARMLDSHPSACVASDPFLPLFIGARKAVMHTADLTRGGCATALLPDCYFQPDQQALLAATLAVSAAHLPISHKQYTDLFEKIRSRASHESPDLIPFLQGEGAHSFEDLFQRTLHSVQQARPKPTLKVVGIKEVWALEFFPLWKSALPDAKCIVIIRDPRAVLASSQAFWGIDPTQVAHPLSLLRAWRKQVALTQHLRCCLPANTFMSIRYEDCVLHSQSTSMSLCAFLGIPFHEDMLNTSKFRDYSTGGVWKANTSTAKSMQGIDRRSLTSWRAHLPKEAVALTELVCGAEMALCGYNLDIPDMDAVFTAMLHWYEHENIKKYSWRCDSGNALEDIGSELLRNELLAAQKPMLNLDIIKNHFIFKEAYTDLHAQMASVQATTTVCNPLSPQKD